MWTEKSVSMENFTQHAKAKPSHTLMLVSRSSSTMPLMSPPVLSTLVSKWWARRWPKTCWRVWTLSDAPSCLVETPSGTSSLRAGGLSDSCLKKSCFKICSTKATHISALARRTLTSMPLSSEEVLIQPPPSLLALKPPPMSNEQNDCTMSATHRLDEPSLRGYEPHLWTYYIYNYYYYY